MRIEVRICHVVYVLWYCFIIFLILRNPNITFVLVLSHWKGLWFILHHSGSLCARLSCPSHWQFPPLLYAVADFFRKPNMQETKGVGPNYLPHFLFWKILIDWESVLFMYIIWNVVNHLAYSAITNRIVCEITFNTSLTLCIACVLLISMLCF